MTLINTSTIIKGTVEQPLSPQYTECHQMCELEFASRRREFGSNCARSGASWQSQEYQPILVIGPRRTVSKKISAVINS